MSMNPQSHARDEVDGLLRRLRDATEALADHQAKAESSAGQAAYDPTIHDQAWVDRLAQLEEEHRQAYDGFLSRWPQLLPHLQRFKTL